MVSHACRLLTVSVTRTADNPVFFARTEDATKRVCDAFGLLPDVARGCDGRRPGGGCAEARAARRCAGCRRECESGRVPHLAGHGRLREGGCAPHFAARVAFGPRGGSAARGDAHVRLNLLAASPYATAPHVAAPMNLGIRIAHGRGDCRSVRAKRPARRRTGSPQSRILIAAVRGHDAFMAGTAPTSRVAPRRERCRGLGLPLRRLQPGAKRRQ